MGRNEHDRDYPMEMKDKLMKGTTVSELCFGQVKYSMCHMCECTRNRKMHDLSYEFMPEVSGGETNKV